MLTWLPRPAAAAVGAAVLLTAAAALAQLPSAEQGAFNAVDDAVSAFRSASGRDEMTRAAGRILDAAERALNAFNAADRARDAAGNRYVAALEQAIAVAVNCENGYHAQGCNNPSGIPVSATAYARGNEALSAVSAANASYVEAVGIAGAAEARERAARFRRFANRMRGLRGNSSDMVRRQTELINEVFAEINSRFALHSRATAAHYAANRAALDALGRAGRTLSTAAGRLTDDYYPATRAAEVTREAAALDRAVAAAADPEVSNDSDRTDAALDELILAAREVLESHVQLVEQAAREYERDPDPALPGQADVNRPADVESEPAGDFAGWVRQINAAVAAAERAADEAEQAAAGSAAGSRARRRASTPRDACRRRSSASRTSRSGPGAPASSRPRAAVRPGRSCASASTRPGSAPAPPAARSSRRAESSPQGPITASYVNKEARSNPGVPAPAAGRRTCHLSTPLVARQLRCAPSPPPRHATPLSRVVPAVRPSDFGRNPRITAVLEHERPATS